MSKGCFTFLKIVFKNNFVEVGEKNKQLYVLPPLVD